MHTKANAMELNQTPMISPLNLFPFVRRAKIQKVFNIHDATPISSTKCKCALKLLLKIFLFETEFRDRILRRNFAYKIRLGDKHS